jgi:CheY-like chemotaxis protein
MGGELSVESRLGRGSRFYFDIQVGLASPDAADVGPAPVARKVVALSPDQPTYRILVADDQESTRQLLIALLAPLGFEAREAANGKEAVQLTESWSPHLIWMDMRMPIMDGYQATQRIKARGQGGAPVIIALTASAFERDRERILSAGCDGFVRKPFRYDEILDALAKHLSVRYVYEERVAELATASGADIAPVLRVDSAPELPGALVAELRQATIRADVQAVLKLIEALRTHDPLLADALADLAYEFEYQQILDLLDRGGPDGEQQEG